MLLAVLTRSTVVCLVGCIAFFALCYSVNFAYHAEGLSAMDRLSLQGFLSAFAYWVLPKPLDLSGIFFDAMDAGAYSIPVPEVAAAKARGAFRPELSVLASLMFAVGALAVAAYEFRKQDY